MVWPVTDTPRQPDPSDILRDLDALQRDLEATRMDVARAERLETLGTLSGMIAHEVRGIASKIVGNAQLIGRDAGDPQRVRELADRIGRLGLHAGRVAEAILAAADEPPTGDCSVLEAHRRALDALPSEARPRIDDSGVDPRDRAAIDPDALERVLVNVYLNAWRAVGGSGEPGRIRVASRLGSSTVSDPNIPSAADPSQCSARNTVTITVSDDGAGVHPELGEVLFEPWSRASSGAGHGLGLALCRHLLDAVGGSIRFDQQPGSGATVIIELPRAGSQRSARVA